MSSEHAKKRQKRSRCDAPDGAMANMEALFDQKLSQMEQTMEGKMDAMQSEMDAMKDRLSRVDELEERCRYLEVKCASMGRSLQVLANRWECSAPHIPDSHWTEQGFDGDYATDMVDPFIDNMNGMISNLKKGRLVLDLDLPDFGGDDAQLVHDDALLPHWQNLADALDLYGPTIDKVGGSLCVSDIQLAPKVLALLTPSLAAVKKFTEIKLYQNEFPRACDGTKFAVELIQSSPNLELFQWVGNPLDTINDANCLVDAINSSPSIRHVRLEGCCDVRSNVGNHLLTSLLTETSAFETLDLDSNSIRTMGGTHLSDYLETNPPLKALFLNRNKLDDNDARLIADALKRNTNLIELHLDGNNEITEIGRNALANAIHDRTSLNSASDSNHTCKMYGLRPWIDNRPGQSVDNRRRAKIYHILSSRNEEETNVQYLNVEFDDDDPLKFVPRVLESVYNYKSAHRIPREVCPLSIFYELLRGWKMPSLYENGKVQ